ncbi:MAG: OmpA family protein [Cyclobacteriaceae bacterium]|nr:OmpA family protein [Cyclobacteriaceae bacterium]
MKPALLAGLVFVTAAAFGQFSPRYELVKLKEVNSFYDEAAPIVSPNGKDLYFFIQDHPENTYGKVGSQDIWVSHKDDNGSWSKPTHAAAPLNQSRSNQVFTVLPDGSLFVRGGRSKNSKGFSIVSPGGAWTELNVRDFDAMEKGRFYGAALSADAKHMVLYFSEIQGGLKSDLYISHQEPAGAWSKPAKLKITTTADDFGPFISVDQKFLYFASDRAGQGRQGLVDIYRSQRLDDTWDNWGEPQNIGRPINTAAEDYYFSMDADGNVFSSRSNSKLDGGNLDISVLVPKNIKVTLNGTITNAKTSQPLPANVTITVKDVKPVVFKNAAGGKVTTRIPETNQYIVSASADGFSPREETFTVPKLNADTTLNFELALRPLSKPLVINGTVVDRKTGNAVEAKVQLSLRGDASPAVSLTAAGGRFTQDVARTGRYLFSVSAEGYLNASDSLEYDNEDVSPMTKTIELSPIEVGVTVRLKNIYFDFNKATLKSESFVELNKVLDFLNTNPHVEIEIAGHTDAVGTDENNLNLSQGRSQSVVDYLTSQGIARARLTAHGYGESKPIDTNDTDAGRANNRRVEFTVLKK